MSFSEIHKFHMRNEIGFGFFTDFLWVTRAQKFYNSRYISYCQLTWWPSGWVAWLAIVGTVVRFPDDTSNRKSLKDRWTNKISIWSEIEWRKHKVGDLIEKRMFCLFMIYQNFPVFYASGHGISTYKNIFYVIYPERKWFSGDTSARTFLRFSVKIFQQCSKPFQCYACVKFF